MNKTNFAFRNNTLYLLIGISILAMITSCSQDANSSQVLTQETMKWGFISPLTGTATPYGQPALYAAQIAVEEINTAGGVLGKKIELIVEDGKCEGPASVSAAEKLINVDKVKIILGGHCSTESLAILPVTNASKVFQLASTTSTPAYRGKGRYAMRIMPSSSYFSAKQAEVAYGRGITKVAIIHEQKEYSLGMIGAFKSRFSQIGGEIISEQAFTPGTTDFKTELMKATQSKPDAILISTSGPETAALIFKQMKELEIGIPVMGDIAGITSSAWQKSEGSMPESAWAVSPYVEKDTNSVSKNFFDKYIPKYGDTPMEPSLVAQNYDAVYILKESVEACGGEDPDCIRTQILGIKDRTSAVGTLTYDGDEDPRYGLAVMQIVDGKPVYEPING